MKGYFEKEVMVLPSMCDAEGKLSVPGAFALFMDIATEHAELLGVGMNGIMRQGLFWLTARTRIRFHRRPGLAESITVRTWPETPERSRCNRDYLIAQGGDVLVEGKTEWMVLNTKTNRLWPADGVFPADLEVEAARVLPGPFTRIADDFDGSDSLGSYTVRATDIDLGGHMNNAIYPRVIAGAFSAAAWREMDIAEMEIAFRAPCYEGDVLDLQKKATPEGIALRLSCDNRTIALARIAKGPA